MSLFSKKTTSVEDKILELTKNLSQSDVIDIITNLVNNSSSETQTMLKNILNANDTKNSKTEFYISELINAGSGYLPADIIVKKYDHPQINDIINCYITEEDDSISGLDLKLKNIDIVDGTLFVESLTNPDNCGKIGISNYGYRYEIIEFDSDKWHDLVRVLSLKVDYKELMDTVKDNITYINESDDFYESEKCIKLLEDRVQVLSSKI